MKYIEDKKVCDFMAKNKITVTDFMQSNCPSDFGFTDLGVNDCGVSEEACINCWFRSMTSDEMEFIKCNDNEIEGKGIADAERFEKITNDMLELYKIKNKNYGNSFSEQFKEYGLTSVCIRLEDKIRRLKSLNKQDSQGTNDESIKDTLIDLANYSVLALMELDGFEKVKEIEKEMEFEFKGE